MKELNCIYFGAYFGANITGAEGGSSTKVECDDLGNNLHHTLAEVDYRGAVVYNDDGAQRLTIEDRRVEGTRVLRGVNDNPPLTPGQTLTVQVGSHTVVIEGTPDRGVLFNGKPSNKLTRALEYKRYPPLFGDL